MKHSLPVSGLLLSLFAGTTAAQSNLAITGVTVVDVETGRLRPQSSRPHQRRSGDGRRAESAGQAPQRRANHRRQREVSDSWPPGHARPPEPQRQAHRDRNAAPRRQWCDRRPSVERGCGQRESDRDAGPRPSSRMAGSDRGWHLARTPDPGAGDLAGQRHRGDSRRGCPPSTRPPREKRASSWPATSRNAASTSSRSTTASRERDTSAWPKKLVASESRSRGMSRHR